MNKYRFGNFIVNEHNEEAFLASQDVVVQCKIRNFPLYIYGDTRTGKTHLLYAIENYAKSSNPNRKIIHVSSEEFIEEVLHHVKADRISIFIEKYTSADMLLIDNLEYFDGKKTSIHNLICVIDFLYAHNKQIVLTGHIDLVQLGKIEGFSTIVDKLNRGKVVEIQSIFGHKDANSKRSDDYKDMKYINGVNPLYVYGRNKKVKADILYLIEYYIREMYPDLNIENIKSEKIMEDHINSIKYGDYDKFRKHYYNVELLLMNDIQLLTKSERLTNEFIHIFNKMYENGRQMIFLGNVPPADLKVNEVSKKLASRLEWGRFVEIPHELTPSAKDHEKLVCFVKRLVSLI